MQLQNLHICRAGAKHIGYVPFSGGAASAGSMNVRIHSRGVIGSTATGAAHRPFHLYPPSYYPLHSKVSGPS